MDNERPPVEERISSPSSSEEEEEEKTGPTEDMTAPMPTKVSTAEWVGPPADVPVEPSVTHAILLELKAAWKEVCIYKLCNCAYLLNCVFYFLCLSFRR